MSLWSLWRTIDLLLLLLLQLIKSHRCIRVQAEDASSSIVKYQVPPPSNEEMCLSSKQEKRERDCNSFKVYEQQQESQTNEQ